MGTGGPTCGRGNAGQNSRSGHGIPRGFEGGQTPFHLRQPKMGPKNPNQKEYAYLNLNRLQLLINHGRLDSSKPITLKNLFDAGIRDGRDGIKVLGRGMHRFNIPLTIMATRFTPSAIKAIECAGGQAISIFHDQPDYRLLTRPYVFQAKYQQISHEDGSIAFKGPSKKKDIEYYSTIENRGYLALWDKFKSLEFEENSFYRKNRIFLQFNLNNKENPS